jgi:hypothetical protein
LTICALGCGRRAGPSPQTVGYALTDSPAGLAAWIGERLDSWTDPRAPIPEARILDTLMLYWLPRASGRR